MTERELQYITDILKGQEPQEQPEDWYRVLGFLQCHRVAGLFITGQKNRAFLYRNGRKSCCAIPLKGKSGG